MRPQRPGALRSEEPLVGEQDGAPSHGLAYRGIEFGGGDVVVVVPVGVVVVHTASGVDPLVTGTGAARSSVETNATYPTQPASPMTAPTAKMTARCNGDFCVGWAAMAMVSSSSDRTDADSAESA